MPGARELRRRRRRRRRPCCRRRCIRRRGSGSRRVKSAPRGVAHARGRPRAAAARGPRARRRSRRRAVVERARGTTPSCRRARSAARRRRSPRLARAARRVRRRGRAARAAARGRAEVHVGHALAIAEAQRLELARRRARARARRSGSAASAVADLRPRASPRPPSRARCHRLDREEAREELLRLRPPADREEVDDLDEEPRLAAARARAPSATSSRRPGRKRSWPMRSSGPLGMSRMPVASTTIAPGRPRAKRPYQSSTVGGDEAVLGRAPRHHRRHPGAALELHAPDRDRAEEPRARRLVARRPAAGRGLPPDPLRRAPHRPREFTAEAPC